MTTAEGLRAALDVYKSSPSHPAPEERVPDGCYCPITAMSNIGAPELFKPMYACFIEAAEIGDGGVPRFNATHTTEQVVAAFERAIEIAEAG